MTIIDHLIVLLLSPFLSRNSETRKSFLDDIPFFSMLKQSFNRLVGHASRQLRFNNPVLLDVGKEHEDEETIGMAKQAAYVKSHRHGPVRDDEWRKTLVSPSLSVVKIAGNPTQILRWKGTSERSGTLLMISGNPGIPSFYSHFCSVIHSELGVNICLAGHVGHSVKYPAHKSFQHTLLEQVEHKKELWRLVREEFHPDSEAFYIAGHSIGAWTALQCLDEQQEKFKGGFMLFPVLEDILNTPNGLSQNHVFKWPLRNIVAGIVGGLARLSTHEGLVNLVQRVSNQPPWSAEIVASELLGYSSLLSIFTMSQDEMEMVTALQKNLIVKNIDRLVFYYGTTDDWVPLDRYKSLKAVFPEAKAYIDQFQLPHAFVLSELHAELVAELMVDWIKEMS
jgi:hypothetical protein